MIRLRCGLKIPISLGLVIAALLIAPVTATAQQWDPLQYIELLDEADRTYTQVQALPIGYQEARHDLMRETLRLKQQALEMLRRALLAGQVPEDEQGAMVDLFNLQENVMYLLIELDQCTAAELLVERALSDVTILPDGGPEHLEDLRPAIEECRIRIEMDQHRWEHTRYQVLLADIESWKAQADAEAAAGNQEGHKDALFELAQRQAAALGILRDAMMGGQIDPASSAAQTELFQLYDDIVSTFLELNQCEFAERRLEFAIDDASVLIEGRPSHFQDRLAEVDACAQRVREELGATGSQVEPQVRYIPEDEDGPPVPNRAEVGATPWILFGVAGAAGITALTLDLLTAGDRDDLESMRADCEAGVCDYEAAVALSNDINDRKVVIGVLTGVAVVTGVVALVMLLFDDTKEVRSIIDMDEVTPVVGVDEVGVRVTF